MACEALACHPSQIPEMQAEMRKRMGTTTEFDSMGRPILQNRAHRKQYLAAHEVFDRDGGYGD